MPDRNAVKIAILGWGSLIPSPRDLSIARDWQEAGPILEIEFSRISGDGRLTLVIDPVHGSAVTTLYATSTYEQLEDAVCNLMAREKTDRNNIGVASKRISENRSCNHPEVLPAVQEWLNASNFSTDDAYEYLESLAPVCKENARKYIRQAPPQTKTALRQYLDTRGWL